MYKIYQFKHNGLEGLGFFESSTFTKLLNESVSNYMHNTYGILMSRAQFNELSDYNRMKENIVDPLFYHLAENNSFRAKVMKEISSRIVKKTDNKKKDKYAPFVSKTTQQIYNSITEDSLKQSQTLSGERLRIIKQLVRGLGINNKLEDRYKILSYNDYLKYFPFIKRDNMMSIHYKNTIINFKNSAEYKNAFTSYSKLSSTSYNALFSDIRSNTIGNFPLILNKKSVNAGYFTKPLSRIPSL